MFVSFKIICLISHSLVFHTISMRKYEGAARILRFLCVNLDLSLGFAGTDGDGSSKSRLDGRATVA